MFHRECTPLNSNQLIAKIYSIWFQDSLSLSLSQASDRINANEKRKINFKHNLKKKKNILKSLI